MNDPCVKTQPVPIQVMILKERSNFHLRCNTLKSYATLLLSEINDNIREISEAFEEWIITAVKLENKVASNVIKVLENAVNSDASYLDNIKVGSIDAQSAISRVQLDEGLP